MHTVATAIFVLMGMAPATEVSAQQAPPTPRTSTVAQTKAAAATPPAVSSASTPGTPASKAPQSAPAEQPEPAQWHIQGALKLSSLGKALRASEGSDAVVYWRPKVPAADALKPSEYVMSTQRKTFVPSVLPIVVGSTVRFPNNDPILHNAFSTAEGNAFDTGVYGQGEGEAELFKSPGLVRVYCNVHHAMTAHILVLDTPYFAKPDVQGRFKFEVPAGAGELFVWHERAPLWRKPLELVADTEVAVDLDLSKRKVPTHLNKFGKPYRRQGSGY